MFVTIYLNKVIMKYQLISNFSIKFCVFVGFLNFCSLPIQIPQNKTYRDRETFEIFGMKSEK